MDDLDTSKIDLQSAAFEVLARAVLQSDGRLQGVLITSDGVVMCIAPLNMSPQNAARLAAKASEQLLRSDNVSH